jgi:putative transposase
MDLKFRKVKKPNYGGHIERYLGTLLGEIHTLSGTTFSNPKDRDNYDSEAKAVMTLKEFEEWLANLILGTYHNREHGELGISPLQRYRDLVMGSNERPGMGTLPIVTDAEKLRIDLLPYEERTIQTYGVQIDGIEYYADVLRRWVGATDPKHKRAKRKFIFRRDPRDISYLLFWDPDVMRYFRIPYRDLKRPKMSIWELRAVQRFLAKEGKKNADEETIFKAFDRMREIEKNATKQTRKMRLDRERRRQHLAMPPLLSDDADVAELEPPPPYDPAKITPFAEVEDG